MTPVPLDIKIIKITAKVVYYALTANGQAQKWIVPEGSTFNTAVLVPGTRYIVNSKVIRILKWDYKRLKHVAKERYDWISATASPSSTKVQARSAKQRMASAALAAMLMVDDGTLFAW